MFKDFLKWIKLKFKLSLKQNYASFEEGDVFWCCLGQNIGSEENGKHDYFTRPVVIIKKFNLSFCLILPLSTSIKNGQYYTKINFKNLNQVVLLSQIRCVDASRLRNRMGRLTNQELTKVISDFKNIL